MRICFDLRWARGRPDGIGIHASRLARHLVALPSGHEWLFLFDGEPAARELGGWLRTAAVRPVRSLVTPTRLLTVADWRRLPRWLADEGIDLFHSPNFLISPLPGRYRIVVTVHDLIPVARSRFSKGERLRWRVFFGVKRLPAACLKRADGIIAVSETTRRELADLFGLDRGVHVVPNGVDLEDEWKDEGKGYEARRDISLPPQYILYVGRQDPHKNLDTLFRAYARLDPGARTVYPLVLCGPIDPRFQGPLHALAEQLDIAPCLRTLGTVSRGTLAAVYRGATLLVHPSRQEGFGLTVLEAMAFGLPVIALRIPAIEEVAGDAARLVEPGREEAEALAGGIQSLLSDREDRERLSAAGRARAALFSWDRCARATLGVYERVARQGGGRGANRN